MKIGLFGGSFDPIHLGHIAIAREACKRESFQHFFFIPTACSPFKPQNAFLDNSNRIKLLKAALDEEKNNLFQISSFEIQKGGVSYSYETIQHFQKLYPNASLYWVGGDDLLPSLSQWKMAEWIQTQVNFLLFRRHPKTIIKIPTGFNVTFFEIEPFPFASSQIRQEIKRGVKAATILGLSTTVAQMIDEEDFYR